MSDDMWSAILAHRERLLVVARRRCPSAADAEDVVHEAMVRCATFAGLDPDRLGPFLTSVTMRLCADLHRAAGRDGRITGRLAVEPERVEPGPEDITCGDAYARAIEALVATLPSRQRDVLVDRADGLSMTQICTRRSLTYKAAESALARARGTLRAMLPSLLTGIAALVATLRRRRVVLTTAVPVAAVVALGAVVTMPFLGVRPPVVALPATAQVRGLSGDPADAASHGPGRIALAAESAVPARHAPHRSHGGKPSKRPPFLQIGDSGDPVSIKGEDNRRPESPQDYVMKCVRDGVWINVSDPLRPYQGCGS